MPLTFDALFHAATASPVNPIGDAPYGYQCRLASGPGLNRSDAIVGIRAHRSPLTGILPDN